MVTLFKMSFKEDKGSCKILPHPMHFLIPHHIFSGTSSRGLQHSGEVPEARGMEHFYDLFFPLFSFRDIFKIRENWPLIEKKNPMMRNFRIFSLPKFSILALIKKSFLIILFYF